MSTEPTIRSLNARVVSFDRNAFERSMSSDAAAMLRPLDEYQPGDYIVLAGSLFVSVAACDRMAAGDDTVKALLAGGMIAAMPPVPDFRGVLGMCDDDGIGKGLLPNGALSSLVPEWSGVRGTVVFDGADHLGNVLPQEFVDRVRERLT